MLLFDPEKIDLADLIGIPYKDKGRSLTGLDCYGLAIAAVKIITGKDLNDVIYKNHAPELAQEFAPTLNVKKTSDIKPGNVLEMTFNNELHIGVILDKKTFIHATTNEGVRVNNIRNAPIKNIYEVL